MKQLRQLCAAFILTLVISVAALADDGTIHTGAPPPPPPPMQQLSSESVEPAATEPTGDEPSIFEAATAAALDVLLHALTLF